MAVLSTLALVQADRRASEALRFGFEREGVSVVPAADADQLRAALACGTEVIIAGGISADEGRASLALARSAVSDAAERVPILYFGNGVARSEALEGGAAEILPAPAYARDVITMARLVAGGGDRRPICGELSDHFGLFYLIRAISAVRHRGVLTLVRGLRRGELRFYDGEITSAQVGILHGVSALHQLLLWTAAHFELRGEDVVRRRQIPLEPAEVMEEAQRFLVELHKVAGTLSPSAVLEIDSSAQTAGLPEEVRAVLRLFDGSRTVADVVEDSPFRMFETLRVAKRLVSLKHVRVAAVGAPTHRARTALAIEEWLVGGDRADEGRAAASAHGAAGPDDSDWSAILPSRASVDHPSLSPVVPSTVAAGGIRIPDDRPSSRAVRVGSEGVEVPERERIEERIGSRELASVFVDDELMADAARADAARADAAPADAPEAARPTIRADWEEVTEPANRAALVAAADSAPSAPRVPGPTEETPAAQPIAPAAQPIAPAAQPIAPAAQPIVPAAQPTQPVAPAQSGPAAASGQIIARDTSSSSAAAESPERVSDSVITDLSSLGRPPAPLDQTAAAAPSSAARGGGADRQEHDRDFAASEQGRAFSEDEEAFFHRGTEEPTVGVPAVETFEDLDEDYEMPRTFWDRFFTRPDQVPKRKKK